MRTKSKHLRNADMKKLDNTAKGFLAFSLAITGLMAVLFSATWHKGCDPAHPYHKVFANLCLQEAR